MPAPAVREPSAPLLSDTVFERCPRPHPKIVLHQPSAGIGDTVSDIATEAGQYRLTKRERAGLTAEQTGQFVGQIEEDADRDRWFTADEATAYGSVDHEVARLN